MAGYCEKKDPLEFSTEIEKWDQETPADGKEMAKPIEKLYNNTEFNKKGVEDVKNPEFDASGNASGITNFQKMIDSITSKMSIFSFFANLKTGLKYVLDVGKIVNNGTTTEAGKFVLDAIQANPNIAGTLAKQIKENQDAISSLNASSYFLSKDKRYSISVLGIIGAGGDLFFTIPIPYGKQVELEYLNCANIGPVSDPQRFVNEKYGATLNVRITDHSLFDPEQPQGYAWIVIK